MRRTSPRQLHRGPAFSKRRRVKILPRRFAARGEYFAAPTCGAGRILCRAAVFPLPALALPYRRFARFEKTCPAAVLHGLKNLPRLPARRPCRSCPSGAAPALSRLFGAEHYYYSINFCFVNTRFCKPALCLPPHFLQRQRRPILKRRSILRRHR